MGLLRGSTAKEMPMLQLEHGHGVNDSLTDHKGARKGYDVCDLSKVRPRAPLTLITFLNVTLILNLINTENLRRVKTVSVSEIRGIAQRGSINVRIKRDLFRSIASSLTPIAFVRR